MLPLLEVFEEVKKRNYDIKFGSRGCLEISKKGIVILQCSFWYEKGKDIREVSGKIDLPDKQKISFEKMDDIYFLEDHRLAIVFEDKRGKKQILKEAGNKWILKDFRE
mgnify:CR=1 FL=1